ncbi:MAG TPA: N-acetylmuramoyl-L-alanine amidase [Chitinophagaceae bacterium]
MLRLWLFAGILCSTRCVAQTNSPVLMTGKTTGLLSYLEYGLGDDRLGGAKMTYLDTNVVVKVVDSIYNDYKLQLSKNHFAYLPKINFKPDTLPTSRPYYLTGSWKVWGDSIYDYVAVSLDEQLPYRSQQLVNPSKITVDIFGATTNTNWITQLASAEEVKNVYYEQTEDDVFRLTIELKHSHHWGYSIYYLDKRLTIKIKRQPAVLSLDKLKIAIDAGHGGTNTGASGKTTRVLEKDYTLKIAKELQKALEQEKATVYMTRDKDTSLSMTERWEMVKQQEPDLLISIHLNSSGKDSIQGVSTYYKHIGFRPMTQFILKRMLETGLKEFGNIGSFNFTLNGPTDYPNCLVEVAFLSNPEDEKRILDPAFQILTAQKITKGIKDWLRSIKN